ncbi:MAG: hypothetical protein WCP11_03060 [Candidatus Saccharibacteria bacterium]
MRIDIIDNHLAKLDLDLRKSHNGRFMDQKLTHDNLSFICDCILNLVNGDYSRSFTTRDLWDLEYFCKQVIFVYNKPDPKTQAENEYDKFINQPLRLLVYAGVLNDRKVGVSYVYTINNCDLLEYIALNHVNAFNFLVKYLTKVLVDSGEIHYFDNYEQHFKDGDIDNDDLAGLRSHYADFIRSNTPINGDFEPNRIFNKILNILAIYRRMPGTQRGRITDYPMALNDLVYNAINWRDLDKRKDITREEAAKLGEINEHLNRVTDYEMAKAKAAIRRRHNNVSELNDELAIGEATQAHHIFSDSRNPEYRAFTENLILLTPSQHNTKAHPGNNTQLLGKDYQKECLLAKLNSIEESEFNCDGFYSLPKFVGMINKVMFGLNIPDDSTIDDVRQVLNSYTRVE